MNFNNNNNQKDLIWFLNDKIQIKQKFYFSNFDENNLDALETGMVPVESVHIEHIQADGTITEISNIGTLGVNPYYKEINNIFEKSKVKTL